MAMHESQSLLMEIRTITRFGAFGPLVRETFGVDGPSGAMTHSIGATYVCRGLIRVDADEVTYPLHVILRYRLEKFTDGALSVADLPEAWNTLFEDLLGIKVDHRHGVMQDVHWYEGLIGYFPTYTCAPTAAQLYAAACTAHPDIPDRLACGDFTRLLQWLHTHVHAQAFLSFQRSCRCDGNRWIRACLRRISRVLFVTILSVGKN